MNCSFSLGFTTCCKCSSATVMENTLHAMESTDATTGNSTSFIQ